jgi:hypothetical protein
MEARMRYFGERWPAPILDDAVECDLPDGSCVCCDEPFAPGDSGWVWLSGQAVHVECGVRQALGGVNHQLGLCICCGGTRDPDPPGLSRRDAARAALKLHVQKGQG